MNDALMSSTSFWLDAKSRDAGYTAPMLIAQFISGVLGCEGRIEAAGSDFAFVRFADGKPLVLQVDCNTESP